MFILDLSLSNEELYPRDRLEMSRQGRKYRWQLITPMSKGLDIIKQSARDVFLRNGFSESQRGDAIVLTSFALGWPLAGIAFVATSFFDEVYLENESGRVLLFSCKTN